MIERLRRFLRMWPIGTPESEPETGWETGLETRDPRVMKRGWELLHEEMDRQEAAEPKTAPYATPYTGDTAAGWARAKAANPHWVDLPFPDPERALILAAVTWREAFNEYASGTGTTETALAEAVDAWKATLTPHPTYYAAPSGKLYAWDPADE